MIRPVNTGSKISCADVPVTASLSRQSRLVATPGTGKRVSSVNGRMSDIRSRHFGAPFHAAPFVPKYLNSKSGRLNPLQMSAVQDKDEAISFDAFKEFEKKIRRKSLENLLEKTSEFGQ